MKFIIMALFATMVVEANKRGGKKRLTQMEKDALDCKKDAYWSWWTYTDKTSHTKPWDKENREGHEVHDSGCKCIDKPLPRGNVCLVSDDHKPRPGWSCTCNTRVKMAKGAFPEFPDLEGPLYYCEMVKPIFNHCANERIHREPTPLFPNGDPALKKKDEMYDEMMYEYFGI